jgi:hypothetical protein
MIDINQDEIFQKNKRVHPFIPRKKLRNFGRVESRIFEEKVERYKLNRLRQINGNEKQQYNKNNAELETKWTKKVWKTFEENVRRGQNNFMKT